jgi:hypothetical protein
VAERYPDPVKEIEMEIYAEYDVLVDIYNRKQRRMLKPSDGIPWASVSRKGRSMIWHLFRGKK